MLTKVRKEETLKKLQKSYSWMSLLNFQNICNKIDSNFILNVSTKIDT